MVGRPAGPWGRGPMVGRPAGPWGRGPMVGRPAGPTADSVLLDAGDLQDGAVSLRVDAGEDAFGVLLVGAGDVDRRHVVSLP
jgi:hypothetical protein